MLTLNPKTPSFSLAPVGDVHARTVPRQNAPIVARMRFFFLNYMTYNMYKINFALNFKNNMHKTVTYHTMLQHTVAAVVPPSQLYDYFLHR